MNKVLKEIAPYLALGFTTLVPAICAAQESSVQLYGSVGAGITYKTNQKGGTHVTEMTSNLLSASLLGLKGREDLGGGVNTLFQLESSISATTGTAGATVAGTPKFWNRQSYLGLEFGRAATVTVGRQFHASTDRVVRSLDVYNVAGPSAQTAPIALFGINRFAGNDTRVDNSIKLRLNGPAGTTLGISAGLDQGTGRSVSFDLAQTTGSYVLAVYGVKYHAPSATTATGINPTHELVGIGGQLPLGKFTWFLNAAHSSLDATTAGGSTQKNRLLVSGVRYDMSPVILKAAYTHDNGENISNVNGREGSKKTFVLSAEYFFSKRTSVNVAAFTNSLSSGYRLDPVNISTLGLGPGASSMKGYSIGIRHAF